MNEAELYKELGVLTKDKGRWKERIPYVSSLLNHGSVKAKAHNSGAQIAQSEFSSDCLKIAGNTSCIGQDFRAI